MRDFDATPRPLTPAELQALREAFREAAAWMREQLEAAPIVITGITALSLPQNGFSALWQADAARDPATWQLAGRDLQVADFMGEEGLADAHPALEALGVDLEPWGSGRILAASHERAVFDLLYHWITLEQLDHVPNLQARDIDGGVDFDQARGWIATHEGAIGEAAAERMRAWLARTDY